MGHRAWSIGRYCWQRAEDRISNCGFRNAKLSRSDLNDFYAFYDFSDFYAFYDFYDFNRLPFTAYRSPFTVHRSPLTSYRLLTKIVFYYFLCQIHGTGKGRGHRVEYVDAIFFLLNEKIQDQFLFIPIHQLGTNTNLICRFDISRM